MQDERSQLQNRQRAMQVLRARLLEVAERERDAERSAERRSQVGGGGRGEKIRTYNFKENRITDHRIGFTIYRLADVLAGDLDDVVAALTADERARQLADDVSDVAGPVRLASSCSPRRPATVGERPAARWLCEVASGADRIEDVLDEPATQRMVAHLDAMVARYRTGEPLAYVLGRWSFRHLDLAVDSRVLIPRPETEVVAGVAIDLARQLPPPVTVADLGTGSGAIGLALADELPVDGVTVWLTDESPDALDVARANLAGIGRRGANVRIAEGAWFDALPDGVVLDVAVANPPYVADGVARRRRVGPAVGAARRAVRRTRRSRRHPGARRHGAGTGAAGRLARARDRRRPGPCRRTPARRAAATATSRSGPTSPAATASPSAAWR